MTDIEIELTVRQVSNDGSTTVSRTVSYPGADNPVFRRNVVAKALVRFQSEIVPEMLPAFGEPYTEGA